MDDTVQYSWQEKWLAITPKPFAILSMIGSICIIKHIFTSPKRLVRTSTFHRILLGLSTVDLTTSFNVFLGTWPIPVDTPGVYLASGNAGTCTAQGFWIQLGVGAPLYNASCESKCPSFHIMSDNFLTHTMYGITTHSLIGSVSILFPCYI